MLEHKRYLVNNDSDSNLANTTIIACEKTKDKYDLVESILSASDYYEALGLTDDSTSEEIRRAYIKKSRICHPDKFIPPYPKATQSFQKLSTAYNTLIQPSMKSTYDMSRKSGYSGCCVPCFSQEDNAVDIFEQVIRQLYTEIMEGEFQTLRTVINAMNETNGLIHISEEALSMAEIGFLKIRGIVLTSQKYYNIVKFELLHLHELQDELKNLSYFDVWRRLKLSVAIAKVLIQIPLLINMAAKQEKKGACYAEQDNETSTEDDILGLQLVCGLERAKDMVESTELYTTCWNSASTTAS